MPLHSITKWSSSCYRQTRSLLIHAPQAITWRQKLRKTFIHESGFRGDLIQIVNEHSVDEWWERPTGFHKVRSSNTSSGPSCYVTDKLYLFSSMALKQSLDNRSRGRLLYMRVILMGSHFNINGYSRYRVSYFCNLLKNVKTNHDPLLAAVGVALLGGNSISQMLVFLTQKPIFSSTSYMRVLFEYMIL